ncbi:MAG: 3-dehydroquinate synthase, partial [Nanoarchaeota archaeon]
MEKIIVTTPSKSYPIFMGDMALAELSKLLRKDHSSKRIAVITDSTVKKLYLSVLEKMLPDFLTISIPCGEESKTREMKAQIEDTLLEHHFGKDTLLIAFGGGVVGDLTGFVASTYFRGIPFIQVPTTLLSMVDASIGGKTGINTEHGKNLIGTFYQPEAVIINADFISTLPEEEFLNGLAEIVKMACILDQDLFKAIEKNKEEIVKRKPSAILPLIKRSIELKKDIIEQDELESGLRQILNFGHTIGHALEKASHYHLKHGFAVSMGMAAESRLAVETGILPQEEAERIIQLLKDLALPSEIPLNMASEQQLWEAMKNDKKNRSQEIHCVFLEKIGKIRKILPDKKNVQEKER